MCWSNTKWISSSSHVNVTCSHHDIAFKIGVKNYHSLTPYTLLCPTNKTDRQDITDILLSF